MRERLLQSLKTRLNDAFNNGKDDAVLCQEAVDEVNALLKVIDNSPHDLTVQYAVGMLHYARYHFGYIERKIADFKEDLRAAIPHFSAVHMVLPDPQIPDEVREFLDQIEAWGKRAAELMDQVALPSDLPALDEAIELLRQVDYYLSNDDPALPIPITDLGAALKVRFELTHDVANLEESVRVLERAVEITRSDDPERLSRLSLLKLSLQSRYGRFKDPRDLERATSIGHNVLEEAPPGHPKVPLMLAEFVDLNMAHYALTLNVEAIDEAISYGRRALNAIHDDQEFSASVMSDLGVALRRRGERTGDMDSLNEAVALHRQTTAIFPREHHDWLSMRSDLSETLRVRGETAEDLGSLREAVAVADEVVQVATLRNDPRRAGFLQNCGIAQRAVHRLTGDIAQLHEAVASLRESTETFEGPQRVGALSDFGSALRVLAEATDDLAVLNKAVEVHREAISGSALDDPGVAILRNNLASALRTRYERTKSVQDRTEAIEQLRAVAKVLAAAPSLRLRAAGSWGRLEADAGNWTAAHDGLSTAVDLLPRVAARHLDRGDQERQLRQEPWLVADAVAAALEIGAVDRAAVLLELGRGVLLAHALDFRTDLTDLKQRGERGKELATEFEELRVALDSTADSDHRHHWARRWDELIAKIRRLVDFENFLSPPTATDIRATASAGPIVMFNVSGYRSDALVVESERIRVVKLPQLTPDTMTTNATTFLAALDMIVDGRLPEDRLRAAESRIEDVLRWLWDAVAAPVLAELGVHGVAGPERPRLWWSPSSLLTFLPLHAAGDHSTASTDEPMTVMDRVVSSYTPTVRALRNSRSRQQGAPATGNPLVVAMPTTPGQPDLPGAITETTLIQERFPDAVTLVGAEATSEHVLKRLADHPWAHFSCHGLSDPHDPSASHLLLAGGTKLNIADVSRQHVDGELAYLSACNTRRGGLELVDEAIDLASAFQLAGYRHVVAAMWPIYDDDAPDVTRDVYTSITPGSTTVADTATVLHDAVHRLRAKYSEQPLSWASYVHIGP